MTSRSKGRPEWDALVLAHDCDKLERMAHRVVTAIRAPGANINSALFDERQGATLGHLLEDDVALIADIHPSRFAECGASIGPRQQEAARPIIAHPVTGASMSPSSTSSGDHGIPDRPMASYRTSRGGGNG